MYSKIIIGFCWLNVFALSWIVLLEKIDRKPAMWFWLFFLVVAVGVSITTQSDSKPDQASKEASKDE